MVLLRYWQALPSWNGRCYQRTCLHIEDPRTLPGRRRRSRKDRYSRHCCRNWWRQQHIRRRYQHPPNQHWLGLLYQHQHHLAERCYLNQFWVCAICFVCFRSRCCCRRCRTHFLNGFGLNGFLLLSAVVSFRI